MGISVCQNREGGGHASEQEGEGTNLSCGASAAPSSSRVSTDRALHGAL